jgi:hypothetical protein
MDSRRTTVNHSERQAELERLRAENANLKIREKSGISLQMSGKSAVPLYGIVHFPVTLDKSDRQTQV